MAPLTDYEKYIRTEELLSLQKAPEALSCHDEMQFQVVHQAHELYMKLIEHELRFLCALFERGEIARAVTTLRRVATVQRVLLHSVDLLDTMAPTDYMTIRLGLGRGSGQESPGFRTMLKLPGELVWPAFEALLAKNSVTLRQVYDEPHAHHHLLQVCEGLVDYDQLLQTWRYRHLMLVYRIIGTGTPSLKGKHSDLLAHGLKTRFFPALWEVRDEVFGDWTAAQAAKGHETGYHG
ncbi:MAG: tryptophan 2,3-dioxygenase [Deltaproteobacteria bacterium]|nr:tryptophan 2,3-dioxygenase [Deltaproteobacteria bacterium]MDQ3296525.1 tryptophan 2,3-dioxygenase family protein [Myxococcota bacterium]